MEIEKGTVTVRNCHCGNRTRNCHCGNRKRNCHCGNRKRNCHCGNRIRNCHCGNRKRNCHCGNRISMVDIHGPQVIKTRCLERINIFPLSTPSITTTQHVHIKGWTLHVYFNNIKKASQPQHTRAKVLFK